MDNATNRVSDTARSNQCLDAKKMRSPTAREFYMTHPHSSSCNTGNREEHWGRVRTTPSSPHCVRVFSVHEAVKKG